MQRFGFLFSVTLVLIFTTSVFAASLEKVGYVDLQRALNVCEAGKEAKEKFTRKVKEVEEQLSKKQKELERLKESLQKQSMLLNEEARKNKERDYQAKLRDFQRLYKDSQNDLKQKDAEMTEKMLKEIVEIVQELGAKKNYDIVFEKNESIVLYIVKTFDVTDEIIKIYNEKKKKVKSKK